MKFSCKVVALVFSILTLCLSLSTASAQTVDINSVTSPTSATLNAVTPVNNLTSSGNDLTQLNAWAVGDNGIIVTWDGTQWQTVSSPTSMNLYSVTFNDVNNGWAVGGSRKRRCHLIL